VGCQGVTRVKNSKCPSSKFFRGAGPFLVALLAPSGRVPLARAAGRARSADSREGLRRTLAGAGSSWSIGTGRGNFQPSMNSDYRKANVRQIRPRRRRRAAHGSRATGRARRSKMRSFNVVSFPRKRESRPRHARPSLDARLRGHDTEVLSHPLIFNDSRDQPTQ
jgi:hypothetical protein